MIKIEQQREYVETLSEMWLKTLRVCGSSSKPEMAMLDVLAEARKKLREMEASDESN